MNDNSRILFIDDERNQVQDYIEVLELDGFEVNFCQYKEDLFSILENQNFDVVVLDIMLFQKPPRSSDKFIPSSIDEVTTAGIKLLETLKKYNYPIIILTNVPLNQISINNVQDFNLIRKYQKVSTLPSQLSRIIHEILNRH